jgi:hypothetical protein
MSSIWDIEHFCVFWCLFFKFQTRNACECVWWSVRCDRQALNTENGIPSCIFDIQFICRSKLLLFLNSYRTIRCVLRFFFFFRFSSMLFVSFVQYQFTWFLSQWRNTCNCRKWRASQHLWCQERSLEKSTKLEEVWRRFDKVRVQNGMESWCRMIRGKRGTIMLSVISCVLSVWMTASTYVRHPSHPTRFTNSKDHVICASKNNWDETIRYWDLSQNKYLRYVTRGMIRKKKAQTFYFSLFLACYFL